jgi:hypothetical protein
MAKKLFRCEVEFDYYVLAESEEEAKQDAWKHAREEFGNICDPSPWISEVKSMKQVFNDWPNCLPYGSDDDKTIKQIFEEKEEEPKPHPNQAGLFDPPPPPKKRFRSFKGEREYRRFKNYCSPRYIRCFRGDSMGKRC